ncbi:uncharacterized protein BO87DRAFT_56086 [Aspergillus neoniger CBS 115656]|uniref:Uncharacterized protein n=1 Tax=Aspergillus neoniger (strain CBS 115656) TaxID=1448310 RepID=A0A318YNH6_ASPNB|nr:hypothetical protein BO87DRAFT_56086 [Aspergillus neoniger CBS 115656]PYH34293.1 hypothetical protein BO87DRAFT_56086 [Aspergillus neoniger CBS 115656]
MDKIRHQRGERGISPWAQIWDWPESVVIDQNREPWRRVGKGGSKEGRQERDKQGEQQWTKKGEISVMSWSYYWVRGDGQHRGQVTGPRSAGRVDGGGETPGFHGSPLLLLFTAEARTESDKQCQPGHLQDSSRTRIISPPTVWVWVWVVCQRIHTHIQLQW